MIDLAEYKGAVAWLKRRLAVEASDPAYESVWEGQLLSFEVTYNLSESILRRALSQLSGEESLAQLSSRELMRYAIDEGLTLTSSEAWLRYGLALEQANETLGESFTECLLPLIPQFVEEVEAFTMRLEGRLALVA